MWLPDPREARCVRWDRHTPHIYRMGALWPDGKTRCIGCGRVKGRRYRKPKRENT